MADSVKNSRSTSNASFSIRLRPQDYEILTSYANLRNQSVAEVAREFILKGLRDALDPDDIERRMNEEKDRLLRAAAQMRQPRSSEKGRDND